MQEIPIVLIGHQDHGKSTLIGRLLLETNSIKENRLKEIQQIDKDLGYNFELAHLVDSFREEREKEMTIDTTRVVIKGKKRNYQLIDVPGHAELISNMLTGVAAAQSALLVVAVDEGIKSQTKKHLEIANILGIEQLGVVVNKMDKISYQKGKFNKTVEDLKKVLRKIGYSSKNIQFFPISALKGDNVLKKSAKTPWHRGSFLFDFLENEIREPESFENLPLSFLIQDVYQEEGNEILVGKIETGKLNLGQEILFLPQNKRSKIKIIKDSEGELKEAKANQNVGIILSENLGIKRGMVGVTNNSFFQTGNLISGEVFWISPPSQRELIFESGTAQLIGLLKEPQNINRGEKTKYKILLKEPIVFDNKYKTTLNKIVIKDKGNIIGVGAII